MINVCESVSKVPDLQWKLRELRETNREGLWIHPT